VCHVIGKSFNTHIYVSIHTTNTTRSDDFTELNLLGSGVTSSVYKCRNNVDGWLYAVKIKAGGQHRVPPSSLTEMFALAALGHHPHVIRYYNAWIEDVSLFLQCEYCPGGSVAQRVDAGAVFSESELCILFRQVSDL
jgi:wee1-like protein kinase